MQAFNFIILLLVWICAGSGSPARAESLILPDEGFGAGWSKQSPELIFTANDLYGHINGGAELFLEFGFKQLRVQRYQRERQEFSAELYEMENATAALGIYLMKCGRETPIPDLTARHTANAYQIQMVRGNYYIQVINPSGNADIAQTLTDYCRVLLSLIKETKASVDLWTELPTGNRTPGSERIFRGPYALQALFTFGDGDVFLQKGRIFGVSAKYQDGADSRHYEMRIAYPSTAEAEEAFLNFSEHHDAYLIILKKGNGFISFRDYRQKYGSVRLAGERIELAVGLNHEPEK